MNTFDLLQEKKIGWLIGALALLGTVVAVIAYIDQKKHNALDKELKSLQLEKIKNGN